MTEKNVSEDMRALEAMISKALTRFQKKHGVLVATAVIYHDIGLTNCVIRFDCAVKGSPMDSDDVTLMGRGKD